MDGNRAGRTEEAGREQVLHLSRPVYVDGERLGETGGDGERLGETGGDGERLGEAGVDWGRRGRLGETGET